MLCSAECPQAEPQGADIKLNYRELCMNSPCLLPKHSPHPVLGSGSPRTWTGSLGQDPQNCAQATRAPHPSLRTPHPLASSTEINLMPKVFAVSGLSEVLCPWHAPNRKGIWGSGDPCRHSTATGEGCFPTDSLTSSSSSSCISQLPRHDFPETTCASSYLVFPSRRTSSCA